jgi:hypothetical protein
VSSCKNDEKVFQEHDVDEIHSEVLAPPGNGREADQSITPKILAESCQIWDRFWAAQAPPSEMPNKGPAIRAFGDAVACSKIRNGFLSVFMNRSGASPKATSPSYLLTHNALN